MEQARYWEMSADGQIECLLCPRHCRLEDGQRGACLGRRRVGQVLIAETYGLCSGLAIDPIEKKPLYHFLPGSTVLSFGTVGCNLRCGFCQNHRLSMADCVEGDDVPPEVIASIALAHECQSVAFTYNEPTVYVEYAIDTAIACRKRGLKTVAVTNGWIEAAARLDFYKHIDAANVDLKAFTDGFYRELCGATLAPVLDTLCYLRCETSVHLEVTTLLIPGRNDSEEEVDAMMRWAAEHLGVETPWHFTAYHPTLRWDASPPTPAGTLYRARDIAGSYGFRDVHLGNLRVNIQ